MIFFAKNFRHQKALDEVTMSKGKASSEPFSKSYMIRDGHHPRTGVPRTMHYQNDP